MSEPPTVPNPWNDSSHAFFTVNEHIASSLTEEQKAALGTLIYDGSTFIRSNIALTNGETEEDKLQTIPNLFEAVSCAYQITSTCDFGKNGIKTDRVTYSTAETGDVVFKIQDGDKNDKLYSMQKIVAAIESLNEQMKNIYPEYEPIDIAVEEPEPDTAARTCGAAEPEPSP